ncbi:MAG: hypothetical protein ABSA75_04305 [Candidatus Bathyarchaeia archaeon]|jgi:hypothetical protein
MNKGQKEKKTKVLQTKELPTEELKVVLFRWLSVCEPKKDDD